MARTKSSGQNRLKSEKTRANKQKTTKAMKLVSSAKLRRTRELSEQAKSYAIKISDGMATIGFLIR